MDDWAVCGTEQVRREWTLRVGARRRPSRLAPPRPRPGRPRGLAGLAELAWTAPNAEQPPLLLALGGRLQLASRDGVGILRRVQEHHLDDFWSGLREPDAVDRLSADEREDAPHYGAR